MLNELKSNRKQTWILLGGTALLVLSLSGVVWNDISHIGDVEEQIAGVERQVQDADQRISKIPAIESRVLHERLVVDTYAKILPSDDQINHFVDTITEFANESGIEIHQLDDQSARSRGRKKSREPFVKIIYKLVVKGSVEQFLDFLHAFETYDRFVKVTQLDIATEANTDEPRAGQRHAISLELETYVYNPKGASADPVRIVNAEAKTAQILKTEDLGEPLTLARFEFEPDSDRRDAFIDPRRSKSAPAVAEEGPSATLAARFEELTSGLARIQEALDKGATAKLDLVQRIDFARRIGTEIENFSKSVATVEVKKIFSGTSLEERFRAEIDVPFRKLLAAHGSKGAQGLMEQELGAEVSRLMQLFAKKEYDAVVTATSTLLAVAPGQEISAGMRAHLEKLEALRMRSIARSEFSKKGLSVAGMVFQPSNPDRAVVIVNDRAYSQGESIDDETTVRTIRPGLVTFVFKTEEIEHRLD